MLITIQLNTKEIRRIEAFADTHGKHRELRYFPENTDILVCAGDVCEAGNEKQLQDFFRWFAEQPVKHKLFVPGNHDLSFEFTPEYAASCIPKGIIYIENGGLTLSGIRFYILPARPRLHEKLFVPAKIDILVTHGAPKGILDENSLYGCPLLHEIVEEVKPKIHIFGHCHQDGMQSRKIGETLFCNVAIK